MRRSLVRDSKIKKKRLSLTPHHDVFLCLRTDMCITLYLYYRETSFHYFLVKTSLPLLPRRSSYNQQQSPFATLVDCCCYPIPHHTTHPDKWSNDQLWILDERPQCTVVSYLQINSRYGRGWKCDTAMTKY